MAPGREREPPPALGTRWRTSLRALQLSSSARRVPRRPAEVLVRWGNGGLFERVSRYVREVRNEVRKVIWLNRRQTLTYTGVVVVACGLLAAFMYAFDVLVNLVAHGFVALV